MLSRRAFAVLAVAASLAALSPKSFGTPAGSDPVEVDIRKLTTIDWRPGEDLPKSIQDLDGKEVVISGFMFKRFTTDTDQLLIVNDSCDCSSTPLPHHFVKVKLDKKTKYRGGEITYIGKLSVGAEIEDGFVTSVYRLDGKIF